jgi:hypothetical protein
MDSMEEGFPFAISIQTRFKASAAPRQLFTSLATGGVLGAMIPRRMAGLQEMHPVNDDNAQPGPSQLPTGVQPGIRVHSPLGYASEAALPIASLLLTRQHEQESPGPRVSPQLSPRSSSQRQVLGVIMKIGTTS